MRVQTHGLSLLIKMSYFYDVWVYIKSCIIVVFTYVSHLFCALQKRDKLFMKIICISLSIDGVDGRWCVCGSP